MAKNVRPAEAESQHQLTALAKAFRAPMVATNHVLFRKRHRPRQNAFGALERKVGEVSVTCVWLRRTPTGAEDFPEVVEIVRRYRQPGPSTGPVVVFVPVLRERSVARALLLAVAHEEPNADLRLFCLAAAERELEELKKEVMEIAEVGFEHHVERVLDDAPGTEVSQTVAYQPLRKRVVDQVDRVPAIVVPAMRNALIAHLSSGESIGHQRRQQVERGHKFLW